MSRVPSGNILLSSAPTCIWGDKIYETSEAFLVKPLSANIFVNHSNNAYTEINIYKCVYCVVFSISKLSAKSVSIWTFVSFLAYG